MFSKFIYESKKHIGDRNEQQDDLIILESKDKKRILLVLADGMGGHRGGKQASRSVILAAKDVWQQSAEGTRYSPEGMLEFTITLAFKKMKANGEQANISPRSTCVILFIKDDIAYYCHFGDSRLYHFRKGQLLRRTKDHSVVQMLIDMGQLAEKDMGTHEDQGRLLKWIGGEKAPQEIVVEIAEIRKRDHFLLCSDGLWEYVKLAEMERLLQSKV
ncbi:MAG: serine/threonine-protein phosphatase, partial [Thiomargarita sp.]|nr:serine/threonine-protein phosphatase [Thiomargarita sp.]